MRTVLIAGHAPWIATNVTLKGVDGWVGVGCPFSIARDVYIKEI